MADRNGGICKKGVVPLPVVSFDVYSERSLLLDRSLQPAVPLEWLHIVHGRLAVSYELVQLRPCNQIQYRITTQTLLRHLNVEFNRL